MPTTLSDLFRDFADSTDALIGRFNSPVPNLALYESTCRVIHEDGQALLVVRLQNSWTHFCRSLITLSASNDIDSVNKAVRHIVDLMGFSNPVWHKPEFLVRLARHLALPNADCIDLHFGANISSAHITDVRNYIVHPGSRTESKYRQVAAAEGVPTANVGTLLTLRFPGGATLFERWVIDLQRTARNATT